MRRQGPDRHRQRNAAIDAGKHIGRFLLAAFEGQRHNRRPRSAQAHAQHGRCRWPALSQARDERQTRRLMPAIRERLLSVVKAAVVRGSNEQQARCRLKTASLSGTLAGRIALAFRCQRGIRVAMTKRRRDGTWTGVR